MTSACIKRTLIVGYYVYFNFIKIPNLETLVYYICSSTKREEFSISSYFSIVFFFCNIYNYYIIQHKQTQQKKFLCVNFSFEQND